MTPDTLQLLIATRLEDFATQVEVLLAQGNVADAELLRTEGLALAEAYDSEDMFFFIGDLLGA